MVFKSPSGSHYDRFFLYRMEKINQYINYKVNLNERLFAYEVFHSDFSEQANILIEASQCFTGK
jgi:hypothetical protein